MTSRERLLSALELGKPDRLPVQVHCWMDYYLNKYLGGCDQYEAYRRFGMDSVIYTGPAYIYSDASIAKWQTERKDLGLDDSRNYRLTDIITTPEGTLTLSGAYNEITGWETEHLIKTKEDFELFRKYSPIPERIDFTPVIEARDKVRDDGIVRTVMWGYGQSGPWQSFCCLVGTEQAIFYVIDDPEWVHYVLKILVERQLKVVEMMKGLPIDLVETGGGAGSNTVISPKLHKEFCTPYDRLLHDALHDAGFRVVYHLCGGLMQLLDDVVDNHTDGLETMTPPGMGGDCDLAEASRRVGDKLFFIGGFDQSEGFERGTPKRARELVFQCHAACPNGGYICAPSDHFFHGNPENIQAFVDAAKECLY